MGSGAALSGECRSALDAVAASVAALAAIAGVGVGRSGPDRTGPDGTGPDEADQPGTDQPGPDESGPDQPGEAIQPGTDPVRDADPVRARADACLDGLAELARVEARLAALKVRLATDYMQAAGALV